MSLIGQVVTRLAELKPASLKMVEGALSYAAVQVVPPAQSMPAVYVVELTEGFNAAAGMSGAKTQAGLVTIAAIVWMSARNLDKQAAPDALESLRTAIKDKIFGFAPTGYDGAEFAHAGGRLLLAEDYTVVWQQAFSLQIEARQ